MTGERWTLVALGFITAILGWRVWGVVRPESLAVALHAIEFWGFVLGVAAFVIGVYHVQELRRAVAELNVVQSSLTTRYLGLFPDYLQRIVSVVEGAKRELIVFCDFPGYGDVSAPAMALRYRQALEQKTIDPAVSVEFTCLNASSRRRYLEEQFQGAEWKNWAMSRHRETVLGFLTRRGVADPLQASVGDFLEAMQNADDQLLQQPYLRAAVQLSLHVPIYFWIADRSEAVFTVPALSDEAVEYGFFTSDGALIRALAEMHRRYKASATPL